MAMENDRLRSFSIAIAFDHSMLTLRFLCFHRSGVSVSPQLELAKEDGFRSIVDHMVGILSIRDEAAFGLDMTHTENVYRLNGHNYEIVRTIRNRDSFCGHSTAVFSLKRARDTSALLQSRELTLIDGVSQLPEKMVYELSYQIEGRTSEGTLFSRFFGQFGIIVVTGFHTCSREDVFGSTAHCFSNARFLALADDSPGQDP
ncbi:hypothetical protein EDB86DRAFT_3192629 [Lactarius hatsudake]|nr:hypothetical protein EDB86DRAFT_3192629 [Lactarius hatsudake]